MGPIILIVVSFIAGGTVYWYVNNIWISIVVGVFSAPVIIYLLVTLLDLIFNNPISLRFQSYPGNHNCPSCEERYEEYTSKVSADESIILQCLKCGAEYEFDKSYNQICKTNDSAEKT